MAVKSEFYFKILAFAHGPKFQKAHPKYKGQLFLNISTCGLNT